MKDPTPLSRPRSPEGHLGVGLGPERPSTGRIVVGIDCGLDGAAVALDREGRLVRAVLARDEYTLRLERRTEYRPVAMARLLRELSPDLVIIERQHAMPRMGGTSGVTIGYGWGLWVGVATGLGLPVEVVRAVDWQRVVFRGRPGGGKERAILVAEERVPELPLVEGRRKKPHDGLADACCMALYGMGVGVASEAPVGRGKGAA